MERLTFEGNFCDIAQCRDSACRQGGTCTQRQVWERLKAYEDTGLSPKACKQAREIEDGLSGEDYSIARMVEVMNADKDGRVVVLPCKVGDTVWFARSVFRQVDRPIEATVTGFASYGTTGELIYTTMTVEGQITRRFLEHQIGKTVFLTREEAEKAMEGKKDG